MTFSKPYPVLLYQIPYLLASALPSPAVISSQLGLQASHSTYFSLLQISVNLQMLTKDLLRVLDTFPVSSECREDKGTAHELKEFTRAVRPSRAGKNGQVHRDTLKGRVRE